MKWQLWVAVLVLVIGAFLPMSPASTWARPDSETTGAPVASGPDGLDDARRATSDAASQLSLLTTGTKQLVTGVQELDEGSISLIDALSQAQSGAHELSNGMVQIQAGTGQLGSGATQLADSIGQVVDQVAGLEAVRGQVVAAIDRTLEQTKESKEPDVVETRASLQALREQALVAELPADVVAKMNELKNGSRELANQLAVPGYAYHDGIYTATNGAAALAAGLDEINGRAPEVRVGVEALVDGAGRIDQMAQQSAQKVGAVRAAMPVAPVVSGGAEPVRVASLSPIAAMLVSALLTLGGVVLAGAAMFVRRSGGAPRLVLSLGAVLLAAAGWILVAVLGSDFGFYEYGLAALTVLLGAFAAAGLAAALSSALGILPGLGVAGVLALVQVGLVGWVWRTAATAPVASALVHASSAAPMHWNTAALSAVGNGGSTDALISGLLASLVLAVLGFAAMRPAKAD